MPNASVTTATAVKLGDLRNMRRPNRTSFRSISIANRPFVRGILPLRSRRCRTAIVPVALPPPGQRRAAGSSAPAFQCGNPILPSALHPSDDGKIAHEIAEQCLATSHAILNTLAMASLSLPQFSIRLLVVECQQQ